MSKKIKNGLLVILIIVSIIMIVLTLNYAKTHLSSVKNDNANFGKEMRDFKEGRTR